MNVDVLALFDRCDELADDDAVFDRVLADAEMSARASLWPMGTSLRTFTVMVRSCAMTQPVRSLPALMPSTTMTPTESPSSSTEKSGLSAPRRGYSFTFLFR